MTLGSDAIGNVLRLQGLKNVAGRRKVIPGALPEDENIMQGIEGTSPKIPSDSNLPQSEMGMEFTPQSYDVRANKVGIPEKKEADPGLLSKFGSALYDYAYGPNVGLQTSANPAMRKGVSQTPPVETAQVDMQEGLPPVTASEQEQPGMIEKGLSWLKQSLTPSIEERNIYREQHGPQQPGLVDKLRDQFTPGIHPEFKNQFPDIAEKNPNLKYQEPPPVDPNKLDEAMKHPHGVVVYGAANEFAKHPELVSDFKEITGLDLTEEQNALTSKYELAIDEIQNGLSNVENGYDEDAKRIKERILSNQATDADKYYVGLALLMPLIIGGIFGKEAGLGALGGAAKGFTDIYSKRASNIKNDEELLSGLNKNRADLGIKKGELQLERAKIPESVKKAMPKDPFEDLKGMKNYKFVDPETGDVVGPAPEVLPGLYMNLNYANTEKKRDKAFETAQTLANDKAALQVANTATSKIAEAAQQLKSPSWFGKMIALKLSDDENGALKKFVIQNAPKIIMDGREVNAYTYLNQYLEQVKDAYRRNEQMKSFTKTIADHVGAMAQNPAFEGTEPRDLITQMEILRDRAQNFYVERAESQGFYPQPIKAEFGKQNRDLYSKLNKVESKKAIKPDKDEMARDE